MSLLWRDQLRFALCPDRVILTRLSGGPRQRLLEKQVQSFTPASGEEGWKPALEVAQVMLDAQESKPRADALVILSNHFVRYAIVPWSKHNLSADEEMALARYRFTQIYGDVATHWSLRISESVFGAARLAAAIDQDLLEQSMKMFAGSRTHLRSVQPYLMAAFNHWHSRMSNGWFLLAEPGRICLALLQNDSWVLVRSRNVNDISASELPQILDQERLLCGMADTPKLVQLHMPGEKSFKPPEGSDWSFSELHLPARFGFSPYTDFRFSMAMSGSF